MMAKSPTTAYEATHLQFVVQLPELSLKFRVVLGHGSRTSELLSLLGRWVGPHAKPNSLTTSYSQSNGKAKSIEAQELKVSNFLTP